MQGIRFILLKGRKCKKVEILFILIFFFGRFSVYGQCSTNLLSINLIKNTSYSLIIHPNNIPPGNDTIYYEFGLKGFIPGTGSLPGAGGTMLKRITGGNDNIQGLQPQTFYDIYLRCHCTNAQWSVNTPVVTFRSLQTCLFFVS